MVLMTEGATSGDIARKLCISQGTADWHVNNILKKMHVHSRDEARRKFVGGGEFLLWGSEVKTYSFPRCMFGSLLVQLQHRYGVRGFNVARSWSASRA
jgi:hypothetical protein